MDHAGKPRVARDRTVLWVIAVLLAFLVGTQFTGMGPSSLLAQSPPTGARGVYAFTGQVDANRYGLFMLDIEQGTVWFYEIENVGGARRLRLASARSWVYDRYLRDFNVSAPDVRTVQELVARQRIQSIQETGGGHSDAPTGSERADGD